MQMKTKRETITRGSGNVFADLDLPNPEELHLKARLTHLITRIIKQRGWTQSQAAKALDIKQPDISELSRGQRLEHYSVERLMNFLSRLEQKVTITVSSHELPLEEIVIAARKVKGNRRSSHQQSPRF
jgi:predicted XRE-type DNA-binding protein